MGLRLAFLLAIVATAQVGVSLDGLVKSSVRVTLRDGETVTQHFRMGGGGAGPHDDSPAEPAVSITSPARMPARP